MDKEIKDLLENVDIYINNSIKANQDFIKDFDKFKEFCESLITKGRLGEMEFINQYLKDNVVSRETEIVLKQILDIEINDIKYPEQEFSLE